MNFEDIVKEQEETVTTTDLQVAELNHLVTKIENLEETIAEMKKAEKEQKKLKDELFQAMTNAGIKKWETPNGTKITVVESEPDSVKYETTYDEGKFMIENQELWNTYNDTIRKYEIVKEISVKGKKGYARITIPKGEKE